MSRALGGRLMLVGSMLFVGSGLLDGMGQNSPRVGMLEQDGWAAIKAGNLPAADAAFREAVALDPKNAWLQLGAGTVAFLQRRDIDAKAHLEQALALDPKLTPARAQLAQVMRRQGDFQDAIRLYEMVVAEMPDDASVSATLDRWKRERDLHERMRVEVGDFFTVSFEGPEDASMAARALDSLNRAYWRICETFSAFPPKSVPVVLYTSEQFRDITRAPKWAAAAFDGIIRVPVQGADEGEDLDRVLAHEFTHALIRSMTTRNLPTWLNEGLASVLESESGDLEWAMKIVNKAGVKPDLKRLAAPFSRLDGGDAQLAYATSALAARRLLEEAGGAAVANLLRDLGDGVEFEAAFERRVQRTFAEFARQ